MPLDLAAVLGIAVVALAALVLRRRFRGSVVEKDDRLAGQRRDVLRAIKSMQKDQDRTSA